MVTAVGAGVGAGAGPRMPGQGTEPRPLTELVGPAPPVHRFKDNVFPSLGGEHPGRLPTAPRPPAPARPPFQPHGAQGPSVRPRTQLKVRLELQWLKLICVWQTHSILF